GLFLPFQSRFRKRGKFRAFRLALSVSSRDLARRIGLSSSPRLRSVGRRPALTDRFHVPSVPCPFRVALGRDCRSRRLQPGGTDGSDSSVRSLSSRTLVAIEKSS